MPSVFGLDLETLANGLQRAAGSPWRMEVHHGSLTIVNDAYNANPDSVQAALVTVAALPGRHVAILGRMAELGPLELLSLVSDHLRRAVEAGDPPPIVDGEDPIGNRIKNGLKIIVAVFIIFYRFFFAVQN